MLIVPRKVQRDDGVVGLLREVRTAATLPAFRIFEFRISPPSVFYSGKDCKFVVCCTEIRRDGPVRIRVGAGAGHRFAQRGLRGEPRAERREDADSVQGTARAVFWVPLAPRSEARL